MEFLCSLCPRRCKAWRTEEAGQGVCGMPAGLFASYAGLHRWEEPCISGTNGSGAVFFSGCSLKCAYCQNYKISAEKFGKPITEDRLYEIFQCLIDAGAHNINLVNPTHYAHILIRVLEKPLPVPVVWNTSGYESVEMLRALDGKVQIYLPDMKYMLREPAEKYSDAPDYPAVASAAIREMVRQRGKFRINGDGIMESGVIIRHLVLPENITNSLRVIDWVEDTFAPDEVMFSLMSQYTPAGNIKAFPELQRRLLRREYKVVLRYLERSAITAGFRQELSSAKEEYIPNFDLSGL